MANEKVKPPREMRSQRIVDYTLLKIIKGTHVRNDITGLSNKLQIMYVMCMSGDCLR